MNEPYGFGFARDYGSGVSCGFCYATHPPGTPHPFIPLTPSLPMRDGRVTDDTHESSESRTK